MADPKPTVLPTVIQDRANGKSRIAALSSGDSRQSSKKLPYCPNFYRVPRASPLKTPSPLCVSFKSCATPLACTQGPRSLRHTRIEPLKEAAAIYLSSLSGQDTRSLSLATAGHAPARRIRQLSTVMPEKKADVSKPQQPVKPMEDDDEFEEFDVEGTNHSCAALQGCCARLPELDL